MAYTDERAQFPSQVTVLFPTAVNGAPSITPKAVTITADSLGIKNYHTGTKVLRSSAIYDVKLAGLISYWKFDDSLADAANTNNLTHSGVATYATGKLNNGLDLESGATEYAFVADNVTLNYTLKMSWTGWIKPESLAASMCLCSQWAYQTDGCFAIDTRGARSTNSAATSPPRRMTLAQITATPPARC